MNPKINQAISAFIINEFKLEPKSLDEDLHFTEDLGLSGEQLTDFLSRLQEALSLIIPEEKITQIHTLGDLYSSLNPENDETPT